MNRVRILILNAIFLALMVQTLPLEAQVKLVSVSIEPDRTDWDWENYAESISALFVNSIESRVSSGFETREFERDTGATVLRFAFRISQDGELVNFSQIAPHNRYHAYLIQHVARRIAPFRGLPGSFPSFYFDGLITFTCRFQPTRWYKKLYYEQPLDTLELPEHEPMVRKAQSINLLVSTYEPEVTDKKKLLDEFKARIGIAEEITDTSSYTPLALAGRTLLVHVPYDSLDPESQNRLLLQARLERALEDAGGKISREDYDPDEVRRKNEEEAARDAELARQQAEADSILAATADTASAMEPDSLTTPAPVAEVDTTRPVQAVPDTRNLAEAFAGVYQSDFLVFSAGLARDTLSDSALCRIRLYPGAKPSDLKRNLEYKFRYRGQLADSIGFRLVARLIQPPAKPKPPEKPAVAAPDTTKPRATADSTAPVKSTVTATTADSSAAGTAPPQAGARTDSSAATLAPADSTTPLPAMDSTAAPVSDSSSAAVDSSTTAPVTAPSPDSAATSTAPADSSATQP